MINIVIIILLVLLLAASGYAIFLSREINKKIPCKEQPKGFSWKNIIPEELTMDRVAIAYDTHDDRRFRYAFGRFQFYNGRLVGFNKDGNEQPKRVKAEDILFWSRIPDLPKAED